MLGQIQWREDAGRKVILRRQETLGLGVLCAELSPREWGRERRVKKAGKLLWRNGVSRVLVPEGFAHWALLEGWGLRRIEPLPFLRWSAGAAMLAALELRGLELGRCSVALRARRTDRDMALCAQRLAPHVREIIVSAPVGGENLSRWLQREWGIAPRPDTPGVEGCVCFDEGCWETGGVVLVLHEKRVWMDGLAPNLAGRELPSGVEPLPLMAALWEAGMLLPESLSFRREG